MAGIDLGTLSARIKLDSSQAEQELQSFQDKAKATGEKLTSIGTSMAKVGAVGTTAIAGLLKVGGDWQAQVAGTDFAMKNLDKTVQNAITSNSKNAEAIGLTTQQYKDGAVNISTYYKNMGLTAKETAKLSGASMELVADLGAITDMPFDEALGRFKSGLMGNYEALDAFNINISASSLENSEYVKSLGKSWKQLSDNEKMMATYNEIVRQGASAQGLAKQEAEQFSMKMKLVSSKIKELVGQIGQALIPIVEPLVAIFEKVIDKVTKWVGENQKLVGVILAVVGGLSAFLLIAGTVTAVVGAISTAIGVLGISAGTLVGILAGLGVALMTAMGSSKEFLSSMEQGITNAMVNIVSGFTQLLQKLPEIINIGLELIGGLITGVFTGVPNFIASLGNVISMGLSLIKSRLPMWIEEGKNVVMHLIQGLIEKVPQWLTTMGDGVVKVLGVLAKRLPEFLKKGTEIVVQLIQGLAKNIPSICTKMGELLGKVIAKIVEYLPQFIAKGLEIVVKLIAGLISSIPKLLSAGGQLLEAVKEGILNGIGGLLSVGAEIVNGLLSGIKRAWGSLKSWVGGALSSLNPFKGKSIEIEGEVNGDGLQRLNNTPNPMARGISSNPSLFGFSKSRTFEPAKPKTYSTDKSLVSEAKEYVINTVVELEGYQIAKATARYMQDELSNLDRRASRLGGVL